MEFVKTIVNEDDKKQAIFFLPENGKHYLYSFVNNEYAHETMVFRCDENGDSNMQDLISDGGYVESNVMMQRLVDHLVSKGDLICEQEV